jgi:arylsulfatase A-like enzyme
MKKSLTLLTALLLAPLAALLAAESKPANKPNVIVILADDLGWADLSCYGSTFHESPNLDKLAAQGIRFTQGYSSSPMCSPSRAAIMTGRHPARLKITDFIPSNSKSGKFLPAQMKMELPLEEVTIAEVLKNAGYATWSVGKWHLGDRGFFPEDQGFQVNIAGNHIAMVKSYFWPYGDADGDKESTRKEIGPVPGLRGPVPGLRLGGHEGEHLCDRLTSEAIKLIEQRKPEQPFFLYLPFYDVHTPNMGKPDLVKKYEAKATELGLPSVAQAPKSSEGNPARGDTPRKLSDRQVNPIYAAMIENMDTNIGRLMAKLAELGIDDNTLIIFTSDNGGGEVTSNHPMRGGKGWLYEGGVREPWIVKWPGVTKPSSTCDVPIVNSDIFPTVLEAAGLPQRPELHKDGISFIRLLKGKTKPLHDALFWHFPHYGTLGSGPCSSVRVGDWKLIEWLEDDSAELFNLATDLSEKNDVAAQHPEIVRQLRERLHAWRKETDANMPRPKP